MVLKNFRPQGTTPAERIFATQLNPDEDNRVERTSAARDPRNTEQKRELHSLAKAEDNIKETRRHNVRSRLDSQTLDDSTKKTTRQIKIEVIRPEKAEGGQATKGTHSL